MFWCPFLCYFATFFGESTHYSPSLCETRNEFYHPDQVVGGQA
jgi:hypothetical protein